MSPTLVERLAEIVGVDNILMEPGDVAPYLADWRNAYRGRALAVVRPASTEAIAAVLRACIAASVGVVPQGGNTGMCGGATPSIEGNQIVLAMGRMNRVLNVDPLNNTITVEAGCILAAIQQSAEAAGRLFPLSLAAEGSCQIGGNLATNAGGINVLRYGNARDLVLGIEAVLPDGTIWNGLRALRKDNRGYDLKQLFIGSEGTLGIIAKAVLKLFPLPGETVTALIALDNPACAVQLLAQVRERCGDSISAYELMGHSCLELVSRHIPRARIPIEREYPWYLLVELGGVGDAPVRSALEATVAEAIDRGEVRDAVFAESVAQSEAFWRLRETIPEATIAEGAAFRSDISVSISSIATFVESATVAFVSRFPQSRIVCFGHVGDGNLHFNALLPPEYAQSDSIMRDMAGVLYDIVEEFDGSFSAEHGVGQAKRAELIRYKDGIEIDLMRRIKHVFDPLGIMNPGKLL